MARRLHKLSAISSLWLIVWSSSTWFIAAWTGRHSTKSKSKQIYPPPPMPTMRLWKDYRDLMATACLVGSILVSGPSGADEIPPDMSVYETSSYSMMLPSSWKVVSQRKDNLNQNGLLFSAIDLKGGATVTVVREQACPVQEYFEKPKLCDLPVPKEGLIFSSEESMNGVLKKAVIRRDDRDNAVLGANPTKIDAMTRIDDRHAELVASTEIPTGAVKKDAIGRTVQESIVRVVKTKISIQQLEEDSSAAPSLLSVWMSAPLDEWQKPVSAIRLQQAVDSVALP